MQREWGRVLGGAARTQMAIRAEWKARAEIVEARVTEFEVLSTARVAYMQEEIARSLAWEKEI